MNVGLDSSIVIGIGSFVLNLIVLAVGGTRWIERIKADARKELDEEMARTRRETGEGLAAMRQKVVEVELWGRDNFVRKESFNMVVAQLQTGLRDLGNKFDVGMSRLADKIDEKVGPRD